MVLTVVIAIHLMTLWGVIGGSERKPNMNSIAGGSFTPTRIRLTPIDTNATVSTDNERMPVEFGKPDSKLRTNNGSEEEEMESTSSWERRAEPRENWLLPYELLDHYQFIRIVFEVSVLASGEIDEVKMLSVKPQDIDAPTRRLIEELLQQTPMDPATIGGRPINSRRLIEVLLERDE